MRHGPISTRRELISAGAVIAGIGTLAGCTSQEGNEGGGTDTSTVESTTSGAEDDAESGLTESDAVTMEPVGTVEFDAVPETWVANNGSWADMGIALGQEPPEAVWLTERYHTQYYDEIPGVNVDKSGMVSLSDQGVDKELFYEMNADVHVIDPNFLMNRFDGWDEDDIDEIERAIAPFFGNSIFSRDYAWHDEYEYLTLYEAFGKLAEVFDEAERYQAFVEVHDEFQATLDGIVPREDDRPAVAILWPAEEGTFFPYVVDEGTSFKQWHDLGVHDALGTADLEDFHDSRGQIDYENLLEIEPDVLLIRGNEALTEAEFQETVVAEMEDHPVASDLTPVENGEVYRGGPLYQGPITNLVVTERATRQLYDVDEELFDRARVAEIVRGEI
ncbi:ABC transporter substrate-binding protein [Natrarchaeobius sp. A-rgal3]|uniref:ABC transporter substrate-binding protein n=1 Tax=Natrarchaeobius versutus TaxID=1679078 RepID=UPI00350EC8BF